MLDKKRIRLIREITEEDIYIWADEDKILQVINNLLSNAVKYTPEDGAITLKAYNFNGFVRLEFHDSAESISLDQLDKIFDKFQRLSLAKEGSGLGLSAGGGFFVLDNLKNSINTNTIPVLILTAKTDKESEEKSYKLGADLYFRKPFNPEELLAAIKNLL